MAEQAESPPPSFNQQLAALETGETVATSRRLDRCHPETKDISAIKAKLRQSINPAVSKLRKTGQMQFVTDTGEFITQDGHVMVVVAVTRLG